MTWSLPEERMLSGKAPGQGGEPVQLDPRDQDLVKWKEHARRVMDSDERFQNEDLHQILARIVLGL